jgi:hypothetical protein
MLNEVILGRIEKADDVFFDESRSIKKQQRIIIPTLIPIVAA